MDTQKQIHQYINKLTQNFTPDVDYQIYHFLRRLSETTIKGLDVYCFSCKSGRLFKLFNTDGVSLSLIHPLPSSESALCITLIRASGPDENIYTISAGTFNLSKTAGDPADLSAVRMEKVILDAVSGETPETIKRNGMYRDYQRIFEKTYKEKNNSLFLGFFLNLLPKSEKEKVVGQIIHDLKNLENLMRWLIETKQLNRLRSRQAFNY